MLNEEASKVNVRRRMDLATGSSGHVAIFILAHQKFGHPYHPLRQLAQGSAGVLLLNGPMTRWSDGQMTQPLSRCNPEPTSRHLR